jgi:hypothetical protein
MIQINQKGIFAKKQPDNKEEDNDDCEDCEEIDIVEEKDKYADLLS